MLYKIDYLCWSCGGIVNSKLVPIKLETELFLTKKDMLKRVIEIKRDNSIGDIEISKIVLKNLTNVIL